MRAGARAACIPTLLQSRKISEKGGKHTAIKLSRMRRLGTARRSGDMLNTESQTKSFELLETKQFFQRLRRQVRKMWQTFSALGHISWRQK